MKRKINEDYSVLKNPSPFQIGRDSGYVRDASDKLNLNYQLRRAEEASTFFQKKQMIAQLEQLEEPIAQLYQQLILIRNLISEKSKLPLIPNDKLKVMNNMMVNLDKITSYVTTSLLQKLDKLTLGDDE